MTDTFLRADIFFFITSIAVAIISVVLAVALFQFILILRDVRHVSRRLREEADRIFADVEGVRKFVRKEGKRAVDLKEVMGSVIGTFLSKRKSRRRAAKQQAGEA